MSGFVQKFIQCLLQNTICDTNDDKIKNDNRQIDEHYNASCVGPEQRSGAARAARAAAEHLELEACEAGNQVAALPAAAAAGGARALRPRYLHDRDEQGALSRGHMQLQAHALEWIGRPSREPRAQNVSFNTTWTC